MGGFKATKGATKVQVAQVGGKVQFITTVTPLAATSQPNETYDETGQGMLSWACKGVTQKGMSPPTTHCL